MQANLNQSIRNLCNPIRPLGPSVPFLGSWRATYYRMAPFTCNTADDNAPVHDSVGHNFITNATSATFHYRRGWHQEDMAADDGKHSPGRGCWMECLSKFPADDPLQWHFVELSIIYPKVPLLIIMLAAQVSGGTMTARLLSTAPLNFDRPRYMSSLITLQRSD